MQYFNSIFPQTEPRYCEFGRIIYHLGLTFHSWTAFSWKEAAVQGVKGFLFSLILVWKEFQIIQKGDICKYFSYLKATGVLRIHCKDWYSVRLFCIWSSKVFIFFEQNKNISAPVLLLRGPAAFYCCFPNVTPINFISIRSRPQLFADGAARRSVLQP